MEQLPQVKDALSTPQAAEQSTALRNSAAQTAAADASGATTAQQNPTAMHGLQLIDAVATISMGN